METFSCKRKKRRTRKCLDEMRKRSRLSINSDMNKVAEVKLSQPLALSQKQSSSNCITARRLTLTMFHKAVCSETITRPALAEISHKPFLNVNNIPSNATVSNAKPKFVTSSPGTKCMEFSCNVMAEMFTETNSNNELNNCSDNSQSSCALFSPVNESADADILEDSNHITSTSVSSTLHHTNNYNLYDQFMYTIPEYIEHNASILSQDEVMMKTRSVLNNIYVEHHHFKKKVNDFKDNKEQYNSPITRIVQNAGDYIKLGQVWNQHSTIPEITSCSSDTPFSSLVACSPESSSSPLISNSLTLHSPLMLRSPPVTPGSPLVFSVICDTPEYAYYPHKLNQ